MYLQFLTHTERDAVIMFSVLGASLFLNHLKKFLNAYHQVQASYILRVSKSINKKLELFRCNVHLDSFLNIARFKCFQ